jgi:hypothetical protein
VRSWASKCPLPSCKSRRLAERVSSASTARHFTMTANTEDLISPRLEWRQRDLEF